MHLVAETQSGVGVGDATDVVEDDHEGRHADENMMTTLKSIASATRGLTVISYRYRIDAGRPRSEPKSRATAVRVVPLIAAVILRCASESGINQSLNLT